MQQLTLKVLDSTLKTLPFKNLPLLEKDTHCHLAFENSELSGRHARIEKKENSFIIRDLRSDTGTYVNNARILEAVLQDGDVIRLGNLEMIFVEQTETTTPFPMKSRNDVWHEELQKSWQCR